MLVGDLGTNISQIPVRSFSNLELDIKRGGHVYGAIVLDVLGLCTSIQRLNFEQIVLVICLRLVLV
jgi:hypothetical protein